MRRVCFCSILLWSLLGFSTSQADLVIDNFLDGPQTVVADASNNNTNDLVTGLNSNNVLGGARALTVQGEMTVGFTRAVIDTSVGTLSFESFNPAYSNQFDGRVLLTNIPGNRFDTFDISAHTNDLYVIDFERTFWGATGPDVELLISSPTRSQSFGLTVPESSTPFSVSVPMSQYSGVDFSRAFNMRLDIGQLSPNASFQINQVRFAAVPEPSTFGLTGFWSLGMALRRRRS